MVNVKLITCYFRYSHTKKKKKACIITSKMHRPLTLSLSKEKKKTGSD